MHTLTKVLAEEVERRAAAEKRKKEYAFRAQRLVQRIHTAFDSYIPQLEQLRLRAPNGGVMPLRGGNIDLGAAGIKSPVGLEVLVADGDSTTFLCLHVIADTDTQPLQVILFNSKTGAQMAEPLPTYKDPEVMLESFFSALAKHVVNPEVQLDASSDGPSM